jgi:hypothetical protein
MDFFAYTATEDDKYMDCSSASSKNDWEMFCNGESRCRIIRPHNGWVNYKAQQAQWVIRQKEYDDCVRAMQQQGVKGKR